MFTEIFGLGKTAAMAAILNFTEPNNQHRPHLAAAISSLNFSAGNDSLTRNP